MLSCGQRDCEAKAADWSVQGFSCFLILSGISVASFIEGMHGCDIAIHAGFGSYLSELLQVPISDLVGVAFFMERLLSKKA